MRFAWLKIKKKSFSDSMTLKLDQMAKVFHLNPYSFPLNRCALLRIKCCTHDCALASKKIRIEIKSTSISIAGSQPTRSKYTRIIVLNEHFRKNNNTIDAEKYLHHIPAKQTNPRERTVRFFLLEPTVQLQRNEIQKWNVVKHFITE